MRGDKCPSPVNLKHLDHNFLLEILIIGTNLCVHVSLPEKCWGGSSGVPSNSLNKKVDNVTH